MGRWTTRESTAYHCTELLNYLPFVYLNINKGKICITALCSWCQGRTSSEKKSLHTHNNEIEDLFFLCVIVGQVSQINPVVFCWVFCTLYTQSELGHEPKYRNKKSRVIWRLRERVYGLDPGTSEGFLLGSEHFHRGQSLHRLTMMLEKASPCVVSDSVMRFLQHINKHGLVMDFPLRSVNVFLFSRCRVFWIWTEVSDRAQIVQEGQQKMLCKLLNHSHRSFILCLCTVHHLVAPKFVSDLLCTVLRWKRTHQRRMGFAYLWIK